MMNENLRLLGIDFAKAFDKGIVHTRNKYGKVFEMETNKQVENGHYKDLNEYEPEPKPFRKELPAVWDLVKKDIELRDQSGLEKYGTRLQPFNGRDVLVDAYQEALDLVVYLRQTIYERDNCK